MTSNHKKISLVSPVYNEADNIVEFVRRATLSLKNIGNNFEIILVDDCSTDKTAVCLALLADEFEHLKYITLPENSGQHAATVLGLKMAKGDYIFLMDSDLQAAPEEMESFFSEWYKQNGWDIISGTRVVRSDSAIRNLGSKMMSYAINRITGTDLKDPGSTFILMKRAALNEIIKYEIQAQNLQILIGMLNLKRMEHPIENSGKSQSSYRFTDLFELFILAFLNFTTGKKTLFFLSAAGAVFSIAGFLGIFFLVINGIVQSTVLPTNLLIFYTFLFVIGVQFLLLGIIAFKLERINKNLKFRKSIQYGKNLKGEDL